MVRITEEMIRKRSEHNDCEIFSLEELSLHQQDIEKIEHLDKWCKNLKILYLQNNLIAKIENVGRLKKLEYLNLALNNVEKIENLQGCESLKKLDLTVNFIGELTSIESLRGNIFFEDLYLTGNPCTQYEGYKEYVVATLPQLRWIDGHEIEKSERIKAVQLIETLRKSILLQQQEYFQKRELQKKESENEIKKEVEKEDDVSKTLNEFEREQKKNEDFWNEKVEYTPEARVSIQNKLQESRDKTHDTKFKQPETLKRERRLFNSKGDPLNVNEGKVDFKLSESEDDRALILDVACYKHLDTSLIEADVQPWYVRVTMKGRILQLALMEEVKSDSSTAQRSQTTGHLIITMPKLDPPVIPISRNAEMYENKNAIQEDSKTQTDVSKVKSREFLEVKKHRSLADELASITKQTASLKTKRLKSPKEAENSPNFVDDPEVPPLI